MQQVEVKIVQSEFFHREVERAEGIVVFVVLYPQFGGNEQFLPFQPAVVDGIAYLLLIKISRCRVYQAVARFEGVAYNAFRFVFGDLKHTETDGRHHHPVIQSYFFHYTTHF